MKSNEIKVKSDGTGMKEALTMAEQIGKDADLTPKENLRFRLLTEELFGMFVTVTGDIQSKYYIESEGKSFEVHLKADVDLTLGMKDELIALSTKGENTAAKGFMGKIRDMIGSALLPRDDGPSPLTMGLMSMGSPGGYQVTGDVYDWSLSRYRAEMERSADGDEEAAIAVDEMEKSIVANIADDVRVNIVGSTVEITISKSF